MKYWPILLVSLLFTSNILCAQKVGVVLSGGGARGIAHIGVLRALEENHIPIDYITGTSIGALVGGLYAMGYSPDEIEALVASDNFQNSSSGTIRDELSYYFKKKDNNASWIPVKVSLRTGWQTALPMNLINPVPMDFDLMELSYYAASRSSSNFDSLFVPFRCVAADIETKKPVVFKSGDLGEAIRASFAFPFYFPPVNFEGKTLYDGGLYNNFPVDVMQADFSPDYIIGVDVSGGDPTVVKDMDNILLQIRTMIVNRNNAPLDTNKTVIIEPKVDAGLLDFDDVHTLVYEGYRAAMEKMNTIVNATPNMSDRETIKQRRVDFLAAKKEPLISNIEVSGLTPGEADYVKKILMPENKPISISTLKKRYFQLIADDNIKKIFPKLLYDKSTGQYILQLNIRREDAIIAQFGGNFASKPINTGFIGLQHNFWGNQSLSVSGNLYFGKLYSSGQLRGRLDVPGKLPFFVEPQVCINAFDFFKSQSTFFEDVKPSYLVRRDVQYLLTGGIPVKNKAKLFGGGAYIQLIDDYYQTDKFLKTDTADRTKFNGRTEFIEYERSTLNRKLYANAGTFFNIRVRYVDGRETSQPGSTAIVKKSISDHHDWWNAKFIWDDYFKRRGNLRFGFYSEVNASNQPFFNNYTASILSAPSFEPVPEMRTLFLQSFHSHNYAAVGLKNILTWKRNIELRVEGYVYQPYMEIIDNPDLTAGYSKSFARPYFVATAGAVLNSPVGPLSLSVNYYQDKNKKFEKSLSVLFHFGFILFNKGAIE